MGQSVLYLMPPVTSSRCSEAHGIGQGTAFHRGLERGEIVVDRLARVVTEERGHRVAELTARRVVLQGDADDAGAAAVGSKRTGPACMTSEPATERHAISSFGMSLMISASHSSRTPAGALTIQHERVGAVTRTDSRCDMTWGRCSKFRQNR